MFSPLAPGGLQDLRLPHHHGLPRFPAHPPGLHELQHLQALHAQRAIPGLNRPSQHPGAGFNKNIQVRLENEDLWVKFNEIGTEMIITKTGRRMFPTVRAAASGMDPGQHYFVLMDIVLAEENRYKYSGKEWAIAGKAEPQMPPRMYIHPDSPATGAHWMKHDISFHKVKLTNNNMDQAGHIILTSMHKYHVRLHVVAAQDMFSLQMGHYHTFPFPKTKFLGVTAYQNERITQLKIDNNPFAKGFRENGHLRTGNKRKSEDHGATLTKGEGSTGTVSSSMRSRTDSSGSGGVPSLLDSEDDEVFNDESVPHHQQQQQPAKQHKLSLEVEADSSTVGNVPTSSPYRETIVKSEPENLSPGGRVKPANQVSSMSTSPPPNVTVLSSRPRPHLPISPSALPPRPSPPRLNTAIKPEPETITRDDLNCSSKDEEGEQGAREGARLAVETEEKVVLVSSKEGTTAPIISPPFLSSPFTSPHPFLTSAPHLASFRDLYYQQLVASHNHHNQPHHFPYFPFPTLPPHHNQGVPPTEQQQHPLSLLRLSTTSTSNSPGSPGVRLPALPSSPSLPSYLSLGAEFLARNFPFAKPQS